MQCLRHIQIAARVEAQYFSIDRTGPCWQRIIRPRQVGLYIPAEIPNPEVSLIVSWTNSGILQTEGSSASR